MSKALSQDLRTRVLAAVDAGSSCRGAAARFGVSAASAIRWAARRRAQGRPPQGSGRRSPVGADRGVSRLHSGPLPGEDGYHAHRDQGGAGGAGRRGRPDHGLALLRAAGADVQKRMARPVCKPCVRGDLTGLRQRIRSRGHAPAKMEFGALWSS